MIRRCLLVALALIGAVDAFVPARLIPGLNGYAQNPLAVSAGPRQCRTAAVSVQMGLGDWFGGGKAPAAPSNKRLGSIRPVGEVPQSPKTPKTTKSRIGTARSMATTGRIGTNRGATGRTKRIARAAAPKPTAKTTRAPPSPPATRVGRRIGSTGGFNNKRLGSIRSMGGVTNQRIGSMRSGAFVGRIGSTGTGVDRITSTGRARSSPEIAKATEAAELFAMEAVEAAEAALKSPEAQVAKETAKSAAKSLARRILLTPEERAQAEAAEREVAEEKSMTEKSSASPPRSGRIGSMRPPDETKEWMRTAKNLERKTGALKASLENMAAEKAELMQQMELMEEILTDQQIQVLEESGLVKITRKDS